MVAETFIKESEVFPAKICGGSVGTARAQDPWAARGQASSSDKQRDIHGVLARVSGRCVSV